MSKTKLLFDLLMYANKHKEFTARDVAYEFNISIRSAHRYLMDLHELGVPIYTQQGRNGGYRVLKNRMLPPILFDENEAFAIFFAFKSLGYYQSLPFDVSVDSVSRKLYAGIPDDMKQKVDQLETVLAFWHQKRSMPSPYLRDILDAALTNHVLNMEYMSKHKNERKEVAPIGVYSQNGFWYMPAFDMEQKDIRLYRIDRITTLTFTDKTYAPSITLDAWLNDHKIKTPVRLYVTLTREGVRQCRNEPWLEPYIVTTDHEDGMVDMEIDISEIDYISSYFCRLGVDAKVVEPREAAEKIRDRAFDVYAHYQDTSSS